MFKKSNQDVIQLVNDALERDLPLHPVMQVVERQILQNAYQRLGCHLHVYSALKIPKSSYYDKRRYLLLTSEEQG